MTDAPCGGGHGSPCALVRPDCVAHRVKARRARGGYPFLRPRGRAVGERLVAAKTSPATAQPRRSCATPCEPERRHRVTRAVRAVFWVIAYLGVVIAPLVFATIGASEPDHGFWTNFSVALGFVGLATTGLEFAIVARFQPVAAPFGQDALLQFHRQIGYVGLAFLLVHVAISAKWESLTFVNAVTAPALVWFGMAAVLALITLVVTSVWRRR
jgi:Ferric reductase like transmembrane component